MKKLIGSSLTVLALATTTNAAVLLNEPFTYSDGSLTSVSSGAWAAHSGAGNVPVQVTGDKIQLLTSGTEDVNRSIGVVYSNQTLFASFKLNMSVVPTATTYFAHFLQNSSTFRCRVWAVTNGAAAGKYRLAITSAGSTANTWVPVTTDLDINTDYKVVLRFLGGTNATLWINPTSEASIVNRATGTNDTTALGTWTSQAFAFRQTTGMGTMTIDDLLVGEQFLDVQTIGGPPSISGFVSTNIPANSNTGPIPFLVTDVETPATNLTVTAVSDNPTLVPNNPANLTFSGTDTNRTLTVTPAVSQQGTANIDVVVTDGSGDKATNSFTLKVGSPTISAIANQTVLLGGLKSVGFWVNDDETAPGSLIVTATSSDQGVLPDSNIGVINSGDTNRTLQLTNTAAGVTVVTVTVSDGTLSVPTTFNLTVSSDVGILLAEDFNYPDGSFITNSLFAWSPNTGTTGQTQVANGKLLLADTGSEDLYRWYTNAAAPFANTSGQLIFTRVVVNFSQLPTSTSGNYFLHTYGAAGFYRSRIFSTTNGVTPGKFRLRIGNGTSTFSATQEYPEDLSLGKDYVVINCYNTATSESTLWINPTNVTSASVTGTDSASTGTTYGVSFRQSTGIGSMSIDDLLVGSTFDQVLLVLPPSAPTPENITYSLSGADLIMSWTDPAFKLATGTDVAGITNVISTTSPYTNSLTDPQRYFRLVYP